MAGVAILVAVLFMEQNNDEVELTFLVVEVTSPEVDDVMIRNLRLFEHDSARIRKLVAETEPTGALAALLGGALHEAHSRVGVVLSGANVDAARFAALVG